MDPRAVFASKRSHRRHVRTEQGHNERKHESRSKRASRDRLNVGSGCGASGGEEVRDGSRDGQARRAHSEVLLALEHPPELGMVDEERRSHSLSVGGVDNASEDRDDDHERGRGQHGHPRVASRFAEEPSWMSEGSHREPAEVAVCTGQQGREVGRHGRSMPRFPAAMLDSDGG